MVILFFIILSLSGGLCVYDSLNSDTKMHVQPIAKAIIEATFYDNVPKLKAL